MQCACAILSSLPCPTLQYFFSHYLIKGVIFGEKKEKVTGHKMCIVILSIIYSEPLLIRTRNERDIIKKFILIFM